MRVDIAGRHVAVTEAMEAHVRAKMQKLSRVYNGIQSARVTLIREADRNVAEMEIVALRSQLVSKAEDDHDMYAAIDAAIERLARQITRVKERVHDHRHSKKPGEVLAEESESRAEDEEEAELSDELEEEADQGGA